MVTRMNREPKNSQKFKAAVAEKLDSGVVLDLQQCQRTQLADAARRAQHRKAKEVLALSCMNAKKAGLSHGDAISVLNNFNKGHRITPPKGCHCLGSK